ncbi:MinD/ParA family ATP-binding protein [Microbacterium telephonicum]|uniref:MinD-like ATPase involved in chromosome partitioning or flagellar assembly n=1 Tax=Microbacterium telephonicum TaxID=1714841 RepID=A0A498C2A8_9MICO|nr:MinD/ParA family protein [Microbacterium telephonicum]RLK49675.1 MinD-like ATPase involved in chromosome partitioning or flagellar assembly [Microbacterium telephonicum]
MTSDRNDETQDAENGILSSTDSAGTTDIGITDGATAQIDIALPVADDDDFDDADVVLDDVAFEDLPELTELTEVVDDDEQLLTSTVATTPAAPASVAPAPAAPAVAPTPDDDAHHERVRPRTSEIALQSRRLGDFEPDRESADLLTADRLLDPAHVVQPEPEGAWRHFVYAISGRRINLGDSKRARARKELDRRIAAPLTGGAKFVPVLSRKGGVGKTTVTTLLGMALADARDDRVIAVDANPDRGTLAERIGRTSGRTVRDLVRTHGEVHGFNDLSQIVARDETRLDVLASDADPHVSEAFSDDDYRHVADLAAHFYSVVLTDTGTGIVHSVMTATLELSDQIVIVAGLSVDEARLASETLTWLETNGHSEKVRQAVVVLNTARPGAPLVRADELESHFRSRVRAVVRVPYDPQIAAGSAITFRDLQPETRAAARELAAVVVEGLRAQAAAA